MTEQLRNLIGRYWGIAYREGQEGRTFDTAKGDAAACWHDIEQAITELEARAQPAQAVLIVQDGEICYKSKSDDQSYGMWCPVTPNVDHGLGDGTELYVVPNQAEAVPPTVQHLPADDTEGGLP